MPFYSLVVTVLGGLAVVAVVFAAGLLAALATAGGRSGLRGALRGQERHPLAWAGLVALIAMSGSLYLSEIAHLTPCSLCWYQRIAMYPLVVVFGVAALRGDAGAWRYGLPLSLIGLAISIYHVTIQWMPMLDVGACTTGVPCTGRYMSVFGFVSIPTMAGSAFLLIAALGLLLRALEAEPAPSA